MSLLSKRTLRQRTWMLILAALVIVGVLFWLYQSTQSTNARIESVVRANFPRLCVGQKMLIEHTPSPAEPDLYAVGCETTWARFGFAFQFDIKTCRMLIMSLGPLVYQLDFPPDRDNKLRGCPI
jgi:hypothetical protein